ncbi:hypothetical protein SDRG_01233 [Saprolegnia diclina VS20]|uniref:Uncharacterized protein n=1 Tax=Saprolegnia diclina (strain VS20) TaxID=1156394 RepID=T0S7V7_SAPDV|nr:hypothetical protein SDRG_01233 [Saprolegnia diclina VS20]EQC41258.1 hypothetical protein SDRG_01233 [Saprolegnia diclina VS20]|eukprot:XP_008604972.1 hypothetical protein SDRG_01233 [Saprolegnia diclina VS20]
MVHASVFAEPPLGVRRTADAAAPAGAKRPDDAAAPGQLWVEHVHFPTIKKTTSTPESFRGMKRQTSSRVLQELRSANRVVQDQLDDFRRKLLELDQWIAHGVTETVLETPSAVHAKRKTKRSHKRSHHAGHVTSEPIVSAPALAATAAVAAIPCKQPRTEGDGVIPPPPSDPNLGDTQAAPDDAPCTTTGCWQFLHDFGFFKHLSSLEVDRALEIEHPRVSSPLEPATDSDDGSTSSLASSDRPVLLDKLSPPTDCLTSRLLGALVEEGEHDEASDVDCKPLETPASFHVDVDEANVFLRKELEAIGVLDADDDAAVARDDDEVSVELRKCEQELARHLLATNQRKSALYRVLQARAETNTSAEDHATLKQYHKLQRKRQDAKRKRKQSGKKHHKQQKRQV